MPAASGSLQAGPLRMSLNWGQVGLHSHLGEGEVVKAVLPAAEQMSPSLTRSRHIQRAPDTWWRRSRLAAALRALPSDRVSLSPPHPLPQCTCWNGEGRRTPPAARQPWPRAGRLSAAAASWTTWTERPRPTCCLQAAPSCHRWTPSAAQCLFSLFEKYFCSIFFYFVL